MGDAAATFGPYFSSIEPAGSVSITRGGIPEVDIVVFYARNFSGTFPLPFGISK